MKLKNGKWLLDEISLLNKKKKEREVFRDKQTELDA